MTSTTGLTQAFAAIADSLRRSTVQIRGRQDGNGSGVIWSPDGTIITNAHVVTGTGAEVTLADGRILAGTVTARNQQRDLVALQVMATDLPAVTLGDSDAVRTGEVVVAVGNPLGEVGALTWGIVHSVSDPSHRYWIQTDLKLAPGNSGGVLANAAGAAIGINTMIVDGRGFAIPTRAVDQFLQTASQTANASFRPRLGVTLEPISIAIAAPRSPAWLITRIEPGGPAAQACLQPGDILAGLRGRPFRHSKDLFHVLQHSQAGDGLSLWVLRGNQLITVDVVLWNDSAQVKIA